MRHQPNLHSKLLRNFYAIIFVFILAIPATNAGHTEPEQPKVPIVYSECYNVSLGNLCPGLGALDSILSKAHPFDLAKYKKVYNTLVTQEHISPDRFYKPEAMISNAKLLKEFKLNISGETITSHAHTQKYLESLSNSLNIAKITEIGLLNSIPNFILQSIVLNPMRWATAGTVLATELALDYEWAINIGGGYHHAKIDSGGGFCVFSDIPLAMLTVLEKHPDYKFLIIDLDAHQGNGHEDFLGKNPDLANQIFIFDIYGAGHYPNDKTAQKYISFNFAVPTYLCTTKYYLELLKKELPKTIKTIKDKIKDKNTKLIIIYNAGTDILEGDRVGDMLVSQQGIIDRDEFVFKTAFDNNCPITMVTSGGYTLTSAPVISASISNLIKKFDLLNKRNLE